MNHDEHDYSVGQSFDVGSGLLGGKTKSISGDLKAENKYLDECLEESRLAHNALIDENNGLRLMAESTESKLGSLQAEVERLNRAMNAISEIIHSSRLKV